MCSFYHNYIRYNFSGKKNTFLGAVWHTGTADHCYLCFFFSFYFKEQSGAEDPCGISCPFNTTCAEGPLSSGCRALVSRSLLHPHSLKSSPASDRKNGEPRDKEEQIPASSADGEGGVGTRKSSFCLRTV